MASRNVYLARHCQSLWNCASALEKASNPKLRDADLSPKGREQSESMKMLLSSVKELEEVKLIYSSPLTRAVRTAEAISAALGVPIVILGDLREIRRDIGDIGSSHEILTKRFPTLGPFPPRKWWRNEKCSCPELYECDKCVASRKNRIYEIVAANPSPTLLVSHSDFISSLTGWNLENGDIIQACLALAHH